MYDSFFRERLTDLRLRKGVSEYQMSFDLGHSRSFVHNLSSGKSLPKMKEFFAICEYFGITPSEFFDDGTRLPELVHKAVKGLELLNDSDVLMILGFIDRIKNRKAICDVASKGDD